MASIDQYEQRNTIDMALGNISGITGAPRTSLHLGTDGWTGYYTQAFRNIDDQ